MKNIIFPVILLNILISGCTTFKYQGMDAAEFSDSSAENRDIAFVINYEQANYIQALQKPEFEKYFKEELLNSGFGGLSNEKSLTEFSINVRLNHDASQDWLSFFLYMISLTAYPAASDHIVSFDVDYYKDEEIIRSANYQSNYVQYVSVYFPTALFVGDSAGDYQRKLAADLAENIALDFPAGTEF